jgi:hypothetical protein
MVPAGESLPKMAEQAVRLVAWARLHGSDKLVAAFFPDVFDGPMIPAWHALEGYEPAGHKLVTALGSAATTADPLMCAEAALRGEPALAALFRKFHLPEEQALELLADLFRGSRAPGGECAGKPQRTARGVISRAVWRAAFALARSQFLMQQAELSSAFGVEPSVMEELFEIACALLQSDCDAMAAMIDSAQPVLSASGKSGSKPADLSSGPEWGGYGARGGTPGRTAYCYDGLAVLRMAVARARLGGGVRSSALLDGLAAFANSPSVARLPSAVAALRCAQLASHSTMGSDKTAWKGKFLVTVNPSSARSNGAYQLALAFAAHAAAELPPDPVCVLTRAAREKGVLAAAAKTRESQLVASIQAQMASESSS